MLETGRYSDLTIKCQGKVFRGMCSPIVACTIQPISPTCREVGDIVLLLPSVPLQHTFQARYNKLTRNLYGTVHRAVVCLQSKPLAAHVDGQFLVGPSITLHLKRLSLTEN